jgi:hypothetical protein
MYVARQLSTTSVNATHTLVAHAARAPAALKFKPYEFPAGGRELTNKYRLVALYGSPDSATLGVLGEQPIPAAIDRIKTLAELYRPLSHDPILPTFEIITTIASGTPTDDGDYSRELDPALIAPWVQAAKDAGVYVVLDLQPGRADFLAQAKSYKALLEQPNVGLALDPEWRLAAGQLPMQQIGSVDITEVNAVAQWLAAVAAEYKLPQKLFLLHQFRVDMLPGREQLDVTHHELAYMIQMDGQGSPSAKLDTWNAIIAAQPANTSFGWKNFYDEDTAMLDPTSTMQLTPTPWYISYQ